MELFIIRHGETKHTKERRYTGVTDIPLNNSGKRQVKQLKHRLSKYAIDKVYVSNLKRARQTADILFGRKKTVITPALRELNFGIWEGLTFKQIIKKDIKAYEIWLKKPLEFRPTGGESFAGLNKRITGFIKRVISAKCNRNKQIAIVTHGGPARAIKLHILRKSPSDIWKMKVAPASCLRFKLIKKGLYSSSVISAIADCN